MTRPFLDVIKHSTCFSEVFHKRVSHSDKLIFMNLVEKEVVEKT